MNPALLARMRDSLGRPLLEPINAFAGWLGERSDAGVVLFYGSNLRSGVLDGVLDFYVLTDGPRERGIWPRVSYHEWPHDGLILRAKVATMTLATFAAAARGETGDTTVWARFVQPTVLAWARDEDAGERAAAAVAAAAVTAARFAVALGPDEGTADDYWRALFRATYSAEFRIEQAGRADLVLAADPAHYTSLLPLALAAGGVPCNAAVGERLRPALSPAERTRLLQRWARLKRLGKPLNVLRLVRATRTFEGAARYAAWKVERHTGVPVPLTPWVERHPILAAPGVLWRVWRARRQKTA
ncbi:MAG: hypothetical protein ABW203_02250 [Novosphingobium sp.]